MVCRGPSKGCNRCRLRKVKCDEAKPSCRRCVRFGRDCPGYDDYAEYRKRNRREERSPTTTRKNEPRPQLSEKSEDVAICLLFTQVAPNSGLLTQVTVDLISSLYVKASPPPVIVAATKALAMDHMVRSSASPKHKSQALSANARALRTLNKTLQEPSMVESNQSVEAAILGILALCLRQTPDHLSSFPFNDGNHARGCLAVLKARAQRCPELGLSPDLVWVITTTMTWASIEYANPDLLNQTNACTSKCYDASAECPARVAMLSLMRNILFIRARQKALERNSPSLNLISEVVTLLDDARNTDAMITGGIMYAMAESRHPYRIEPSPHLAEDPFGPKQIYLYGDVPGAILWIRLRGFRLLALGAMVRAALFLEQEEQLAEPRLERLWAERNLCKIADDVCSSHAYCFENESSAGSPSNTQHDAGTWNVTPDKTMLAWELSWTLQMASEFDCVPLTQRNWMQQQVTAYKRQFKLAP